MVMCFALMCMCAKPDSLLVSVHAEEGIDLDDYFGEDEENLEDDDEQDDEDEGDEDEDEDNEMSRVPPLLVAVVAVVVLPVVLSQLPPL